jgi:hypothetical protein
MTEIGFFVRFFYQELRKTGREGDAVRRTSTGVHDVAAVAYAPTLIAVSLWKGASRKGGGVPPRR